MRRSFLKKLLTAAGAPFAWAGGPRAARAAQAGDGAAGAVKVFEMPELLARRQESKKPWLPFLRVPSLYCGVYVLGAGAEDLQKPHDDDEVYYVESGRGVIRVDGEDHDVKPGSIVYVKARADHRFHSIREELKLLVFFSSARPG